MNSEIRVVQLQQGVDVGLPVGMIVPGKKTLANNTTTTDILSYEADINVVRAVTVHYYIYRKVTGSYKSQTGSFTLASYPDAASEADRWKIEEPAVVQRIADMGITLTADSTDEEAATVSAALDNYAGASHDCTIYFTATALLA